MPSSKIKSLLVRYISKSATHEDLEELELWVQDSRNLPIFRGYIKTQFAIELGMNDPNPDEIRERLLREIRRDKNIFRNRKVRSILKYAALAILFISIGYFVKEDILSKIGERPIIPKEDVITLQLDNGDIQILTENGSLNVMDANGKVVGSQKGNRLVYKNEMQTERLSYNTLKVPFGKRFNLVLADGTEIFLNSGSTLKYPVQFLADKKRQVFLEGEAFFDVRHDKENPFLAISQGLSVEVLGTKFNVANYEEDNVTKVVLVDGSVRLESPGNQLPQGKRVILKPGFKGTFHKSDKKITTQKVNTALYTSWIRGQIVFRDSSFDNIVQKLERHYNIIIINNNRELANETFNATIDVDNESIEQVLEYFNKIYGIDYEKISNKIIIN